jgi:tyrosyl-tRNA synthetase
MFGKLTRVPDALIGEYRRLALDFFSDPAEADRVAAGLADGTLDPWAEKRRLAREVVDLYHGEGSGAAAEERFDLVHRDREIPDQVDEVSIPPETVRDGRVWVPRLLVAVGLAGSNAEAKRLIEQGGVRIDGEPLADAETDVPLETLAGATVQVGRSRFVRLR